MAQQADNMRQQLTAIEADKNRLYGSVAQAVNVIEEKYGAYKEVALNDQSYESYVENMRQLYENTSREYRSLTGRIERLTKNCSAGGNQACVELLDEALPCTGKSDNRNIG